MVCSSCGSPLEPGARFCSRCGVAVLPAAPSPYPYSTIACTRVGRHLNTLGFLWMIYGAMPLIGWLIALPVVTGIFGGLGLFPLHHIWSSGFPFPGLAFAWIPFVTAILAIIGAASFLVGFALYRRLPWGRGLAIAFSFWTIFHPPFGTALAIYTWWVLMPQTSAWEYTQLAATT